MPDTGADEAPWKQKRRKRAAHEGNDGSGAPAVSATGEGAEDDDYDPFDEEPTSEVKVEGVGEKQAETELVAEAKDANHLPVPSLRGQLPFKAPPPGAGVAKTPPEAAPTTRLARHKGADRDTRPAWMTKGLGVGVEMFGEATGDLVKPGLTKQDVEALEKRGAGEGADPFGDVFKEKAMAMESKAATAAAPKLHSASPSPPWSQRPELPPGPKPPPRPWSRTNQLPPPPKRRSALVGGDKAGTWRYKTEAQVPETTVNKGKSMATVLGSIGKAAVLSDMSTASDLCAIVKVKARAFAPRMGLRTVPKAKVAPPWRHDESKDALAPPVRGVRGAIPPPMSKCKVPALRRTSPASMHMPHPKLATTMSKACIMPPQRKRQNQALKAQAAPAAPDFVAGAKANVPPAVPRRMKTGAAIAELHFSAEAGGASDGASAMKRQRVEEVAKSKRTNFSPEVLAKAPSVLQTCRSLLEFLDKKMAGAVPVAPEMGGPEPLRQRLEAYADNLGRLAGLRASSGWDARAKRVFDVVSHGSTDGGKAALDARDMQLKSTGETIQQELERSGAAGLESLISERRAWAEKYLKRDWLAWCAGVLRAREAIVVREAKLKSGEAIEDQLALSEVVVDAVGVINALLNGYKPVV